MKKYAIHCGACDELQGYIHAYNKNLDGWCNFHYYQRAENGQWKGCLTPHVSPVTGKLCLECCCGEDTRDFTINQTLPAHISQKIELDNKEGRDFNKYNSKFKVKEVSNG